MAKLLATIKRFVGKSTEGKTNDCPDGSTFLEEDTGNLYGFSIENGWSLKSESNKALRLDLIKRDESLLGELKKVNENLMLVLEALDG